MLFSSESTIAQATGPSVSSSVDRAKFGVGELNQYTISINNGVPTKPVPQSLSVPGLIIQQTSRNQSYINGATRFDFIFTVIAEKAGDFIIPEIEIEVDGLPAKTEKHALSVFERKTPKSAMDSTRPYFAVLETEVKEIYENQMIPFTMTAFSKAQIQEIGKASLEHDAIVVRRPSKLTFGAREVDGLQFYTAIVPATMFALKSGKFKIGPAEMSARIVDTGSSFGPRMLLARMRNQSMTSNSLELNVKPLPPGKPASFTGGVGNFSVTTMASTQQVTVGDPIPLEIVVSGTGNFETMGAPKFLSLGPADWKTYEARKILDPTEDSDGLTPGKVTFSQIVIPQKEMTQIPSFELSFFDPTTATYSTRTTQPIPIQVAPDPRANQPAAAMMSNAGAQNGASSMPDTAKPAAQFNDILTIKTLPPTWRKMPVAATSQPMFWIAQAVPSITLFTLLGIGLVRWAGRRSARKNAEDDGKPQSFTQAAAAIPSANSPRPEYYTAVKQTLVALEREQAGKDKSRIPPETLKAKEALASRCEWLLYGAEEAQRTGNVSEREAAETHEILKHLGTVPPNLAKAKARAEVRGSSKPKPKTDDFDF